MKLAVVSVCRFHQLLSPASARAWPVPRDPCIAIRNSAPVGSSAGFLTQALSRTAQGLLHLIQRLPAPAVSHAEKGGCCLTASLVAQVSTGREPFLIFLLRNLPSPLVPPPLTFISSGQGAESHEGQSWTCGPRAQSNN